MQVYPMWSCGTSTAMPATTQDLMLSLLIHHALDGVVWPAWLRRAGVTSVVTTAVALSLP